MVITANSTDTGVPQVNINGLAARKPRLLVCCSPAVGHTTPVLRIARELAERGYDITFLAGKEFHDAIASFGGKPLPVDEFDPNSWIAREKIPVGVERLLFDMRQYFLDPTVPRKEALYNALEAMHEADPTWPIVIITESWFMGSHAMFNGAPLPKGFTTRPRNVNIHASLNMAFSKDTYPFGLGLAPGTTEEEIAQMNAVNEQMLENGPMKPLLAVEAEIMKGLGAVNYKTPPTLFDSWLLSHDVTLQMCPPSLEYPRSDLSPKMRFTGALTPRPLSKDFVYPSFWDEVTSGEKKLVVTTQGTVAQNYCHIIIPTMRALAERDDVIVVGILGAKGATLPEDFTPPANARVVDYLPYDALLPYASAFSINAGYGGFIHGVVNGVPMVLGGATEDKPDVSMVGEWSGVGINLRTGEPTVEQIGEALNKVLEDGKYKKRVMEIKKENEAMNAIDAVEETILEMAALG